MSTWPSACKKVSSFQVQMTRGRSSTRFPLFAALRLRLQQHLIYVKQGAKRIGIGARRFGLKPCIIYVTARRKNVDQWEDQITWRPRTAAYVLKYGAYPNDGYVVAHICGRSKCVEPTHLKIRSRKINNEHQACHNWIDEHRKKGQVGTIFSDICSHKPRCCKNFGDC